MKPARGAVNRPHLLGGWMPIEKTKGTCTCIDTGRLGDPHSTPPPPKKHPLATSFLVSSYHGGRLVRLVWGWWGSRPVKSEPNKTKNSTDCGDRTRDHEIKSLALYQTELSRRVALCTA